MGNYTNMNKLINLVLVILCRLAIACRDDNNEPGSIATICFVKTNMKHN